MTHKMTDEEKKMRQGLEIGNLIYAWVCGWDKDPRWTEALRRVLRDHGEQAQAA